jgi:hypothetical protein
MIMKINIFSAFKMHAEQKTPRFASTKEASKRIRCFLDDYKLDEAIELFNEAKASRAMDSETALSIAEKIENIKCRKEVLHAGNSLEPIQGNFMDSSLSKEAGMFEVHFTFRSSRQV